MSTSRKITIAAVFVAGGALFLVGRAVDDSILRSIGEALVALQVGALGAWFIRRRTTRR